MKISSRTTRILKNFNDINTGIYIKTGNVIETISHGRNIWAKALVDEDFPDNFAIYDLGKFLGVLALFKEPDVEISRDVLLIKEGSNKAAYRCAEPEMLKTKPPEKAIPEFNYDTAFSLPADTLKDVLKAASTLALQDILITGENGKISLKVLDTKEPTSHTYGVELGDTNVNFSLHFVCDTLKILPADYKVEVCIEKDFARFSSDEGNLEYLLAAEVN